MSMKRRMGRLLGVLSITLAVALPGLSAPAAGKPGSGPKVAFWLTVVHNNDAESALLGIGPGSSFGGASRFATLAEDLRKAAVTGLGPPPPGPRGTIMVSSGDNFLAGPEFAASLEKGPPFYDSIAMDLIGYDAVAIGNHEFDFGPDVLADFIAGFRSPVPFLSANLDVGEEPALQALQDEGRIASSVVVKERGRRIGIVGATTPALPFISSPRNVRVDPDVAGAIQDEVDDLESRGVDMIVLISHLQSIQEDLALAPELEGVDVMVAGGGDELLANDDDLLIPGDETEVFGPYPLIAQDTSGNDIPVVTTSGQYGYAGRLIVGFSSSGNVIEVHDASGPVRVSGVPPDAVDPDPQVQRLVSEPVAQSVADMAANVIGTTEVALDGRRTQIRTEETNEGNLIADSLLWQARELADEFGVDPPQIGIQNGGGIRNDSIIGPGPLTELDTFAMVPFPNFVSVVEDIPAAQLKEILENAVSRVEFVDGRFAQVAGMRFTWDATRQAQVLDAAGGVVTPGERVREVSLDDGTPIVQAGAVVAGAPTVDIATIDFSARGGDQYPFRGAPFTTLGRTYQQALRSYIEVALGGVVRAADYPEGGEGRIVRQS